MSNKSLTLLGILAAVLLAAALIQGYAVKNTSSDSAAAGYLINGLNIENISKIEVGPPGQTVTMQKKNGRYEVVNKDNYPAKISQINALFDASIDVRPQSRITSNSANHPDLAVSEDKARNIIKFFDDKGGLITGILIGKQADGRAGTYVRLANRDEVYLAESVGWIPTGATAYLYTELTKIERDKIAQIEIKGPGTDYKITADPNNHPVLEAVTPVGKKLEDNVLDPAMGALAALSFSDVKKSDANLNFEHTFICRLKDSTVYTIKLARNSDKVYAALTAEFTDTTPITKEKAVESDAVLKQKEAKLLARDGAKDFAERHAGWIYEIPTWQSDNLLKRLPDLFEDAGKTDSQKNPLPSADITASPVE